MEIDPKIFKAYDIRGIIGENLSAELMTAIGRAYATFLKPKRVAVGRDVRNSGLELQTALMDGIRQQGVAVVDIGVVTSDALYFTVGKYGFDGGAMVTASHNPSHWNGVKFTRDQAIPLFAGQGIQQIKDIVVTNKFNPPASQPGSYKELDIQAAYVEQILSFGKLANPRPLKIVIDPGNGTVIRFLSDIMSKLPFAWEGINLEPDGNFPGRNPNPLAAGALDGLAARVVATRADLGVAFDADADRMFFIDDQGKQVLGDVLTALLAEQFLKLYPGAAIVYNLICSHMVPEVITKAGGRPIRSAVGHANMKPAMRQHDAPFGGEISGHFFFRDFYYADSGLAAMVTGLDFLSSQPKPLSELVREIDIYAHDAEVNSTVADIPATLAVLKGKYANGKIDQADGLTVEYADWWFNARPSNTEPVLRLTVEAKTAELMEQRRAELLAIIRQSTQ